MNPHTIFTAAYSLQTGNSQWRAVRAKAEVSKYDGYIIIHDIQLLDNAWVVTTSSQSVLYDAVIAAAQRLNIPDDFMGQSDPYTNTYLSMSGVDKVNE